MCRHNDTKTSSVGPDGRDREESVRRQESECVVATRAGDWQLCFLYLYYYEYVLKKKKRPTRVHTGQ